MEMFEPYTDAQVWAILAAFEDATDDLQWTVDPAKGGRIEFWVACNDTFVTGADAEPIAPEDGDIAALHHARAQADHALWPILWVARKRRQQPLPTVLAQWRKAPWACEVVPLFEIIEIEGADHDQ